VAKTPSRPRDASAPPTDFAQVPPRDLHPVADIRFVMIELGKLTANVDRLIEDMKAHGEGLERRSKENAIEITKVCDRIGPVESGLQTLVDASKAPWWKKIDPANAMLAAIGIVTLLLTLVLGNGRFEDMGKRIDQADKRAEQVEQRSNRTEDRISAKLDQIQADLATIKAERAAASGAK